MTHSFDMVQKMVIQFSQEVREERVMGHIRGDQTSCCSALLLRQALLVCSQNKNEMRVASWTRNNQPEN